MQLNKMMTYFDMALNILLLSLTVRVFNASEGCKNFRLEGKGSNMSQNSNMMKEKTLEY